MDKMKYLIIVGIILVNPIIYKQQSLNSLLVIIGEIILLGIAMSTKNIHVKYLFLGLWLIVTCVNILLSIELLTTNGFNQERLFFNDPQIAIDINRVQREALYLPYSLRKIIYSNSIYIYKWLSNTLNFWRVGNMVDSFGIIGTFLFGLGLRKIYLNNKFNLKVFLVLFIATGLIVGLNRYDVQSNGWYPLAPLILWIEINWLL